MYVCNWAQEGPKTDPRTQVSDILRMVQTNSYEKDDLHAELFGLDENWTKKIFFDRCRLTPEVING